MAKSAGLAGSIAASLAVSAALVGVGISADGAPPSGVELQAGTAWVASSQVGLMTLIDGATAEVAARVDVGDADADLRAAQWRSTGYAVDRAEGTVARIDPATFAVSEPVAVIAGASDRVSAFPTEDVLYVLDEDRGRVALTAADDVGSARGRPQSVADEVASSVVDDRGRLWLLGRTTGELMWFDGRDRHTLAGAVDEPGAGELVLVDGQVAVVDPRARTVTAVGASGARGAQACIDMSSADRSVRFGGSSRRARVYAVSGEDGVLRVSDLDRAQCGDVALPVAEPGDDLGRPEEVAGRVLVPNYTRGTVAVVDLAGEEVRHTRGLVPAETPFELFGKDGIAFYNDPASERAGVVHLDGTFTAVAKYDPRRPDAGVEPPEGRDRPAAESAAPEEAPPADEAPPPGESESDDEQAVRPERPDERGQNPPGDGSESSGPAAEEGPPSAPHSGPRSPGTSTTTTTTTTTTQPVAPPTLANLRTDSSSYVAGERVIAQVDVTGEFSDCSFDVVDPNGAVTWSACLPATGSGGTVTIDSDGTSRIAGTLQISVTVTGPGGQASDSIAVPVNAPPDTTPPNVSIDSADLLAWNMLGDLYLSFSATDAQSPSVSVAVDVHISYWWFCFELGTGPQMQGPRTIDQSYEGGSTAIRFPLDLPCPGGGWYADEMAEADITVTARDIAGNPASTNLHVQESG